ncbi:restriction endonuclease subunit S [Candidatus Woesearchaeota archaeon]|nr:restriction endonuclease subunit S [Candidatus Woesearchaeota archaeon]
MECFCVMSEEVEGRLNPAYYKIKNPFLKSKYELVDIEDYFIVNPKFQNKDTLKVVSFLPMKNINPDLQQVEKFDMIEIEKIKGYTPFEEGDLVFAKVTPCMENGNIAICENMPFKIGVGTSEIYVFRERQKNKITNRFLKSLFSLNDFRQFAKNNFTGTGGLQRVPRDFFNNLKIPLPPLATQNKIVQLMDKAYSSKKSKQAESQKLLDSINNYVLDELGIKLPELKDKMTYIVSSEEVKNTRCDAYYFQPKFEEVEEAVNKGRFEVKELKEVVKKIKTGTTPHQKLAPFTENKEVIFLRNTNLYRNKIILDDVRYVKNELCKNLTYSSKNDIIICIAGTLGLTAVNIFDEKISINQNISSLTLNENVNPHYISSILNLNIYDLLFKRVASLATIFYINNDNLLSIKIPLPPLSVQNKIADEVKRRMQKAETLQKEAKEELEKAKLEVEKIILG